MASKTNAVAIPLAKSVNKQSKPLLAGVEEEKYGTDNRQKDAPKDKKINQKRQINSLSYANINNPNIPNLNKKNKSKIYGITCLFLTICLMFISIYFLNLNKSNVTIQVIRYLIWWIRCSIRLFALYINDRWYFCSKSKFIKIKAELFKFAEFGKMCLFWITSATVLMLFLIAAHFIRWCGAFDSRDTLYYSIGTLTQFIVNLVTFWTFTIVIYWYCDHHIQRINLFANGIGVKQIYRRMSLTRNNIGSSGSGSRSSISSISRVIEINSNNITNVNSRYTSIEQEINYTKQLWQKWVSYAFISDIFGTLFIVILWLTGTDYDIFTWCNNKILQISFVILRECLRFFGSLYGIVRMNTTAKNVIFEKTIKELGCKYINKYTKDISKQIQEQIVLQSFLLKLKEFPVAFKLMGIKIYWKHLSFVLTTTSILLFGALIAQQLDN